MSRLNLHKINSMKQAGDKIVVMTAYDAMFASTVEAAGADVILVGDSLGMVIQGNDSTLPVSVSDIAYHCRCVSTSTEHVMIIADLPFMSYATPAQALGNSARLMTEGGVQMVKMEGGAWLADTIKLLSQQGIPFCGHLGLTPQSVHKLGGYRVQGRDQQAAEDMLEDARALADAGAAMLVLECVPSELAGRITQGTGIPVIGIGAGSDCDGQVLVLHDALGMNQNMPRFCKNFMTGRDSIQAALQAYVDDVRQGLFPGPEHSFQ